MDTSLIDVDVQPTYVRVTVKGKVSVTPEAVTIQKLSLNPASLPQTSLKSEFPPWLSGNGSDKYP